MLEDHKCDKLEDVSNPPISAGVTPESDSRNSVLQGIFGSSARKEEQAQWWQIGLGDVLAETMHEDGIVG